MRRQDKETVRDAARRSNSTIYNLQYIQCVICADVPIVAIWNLHGGWICNTVCLAALVRSVFTAIEKDISDSFPFLQHPLTTRLIAEPCPRMSPPCLCSVKMHPPTSHRHAWQILVARPRLMDKSVIDYTVYPLRIHSVALRLDGKRRRQPTPACVWLRRKTFHADISASPHTGKRRCKPSGTDAYIMIAFSRF